MSDQIIETTPARLMTDAEQGLAYLVYEAVQFAASDTERAQQAQEFRVGISDLGFCSERTRRMLARMTPDDVDMLPAWIGSALGAAAEEAWLRLHPTWFRQPEVTVTLYGDGGTYHVKGHPDLVSPDDGLVLDIKTSRGLAGPERTGPSQQQQFQRHCYAKACWEKGMFIDTPLEQVRVANAWLDRAADDRYAHVHMEPYSEEVVQHATWWLDEVVYNFRHDIVARKEPPRDMCFAVCGFAADCRGGDIPDEQGLITDPALVAAIGMYRDGAAHVKAGERLKDQAKAALDGIHGSTGEYTVSWTKIGPAHIEYDRAASERLNIRPIK